MEVSYIVVIALITFCLGAITKAFVTSVPSKFIPLQNVAIGLISGFICYFAKVEPTLLSSLVLCTTASMGAAGVYDLKTVVKNSSANEVSELENEFETEEIFIDEDEKDFETNDNN